MDGRLYNLVQPPAGPDQLSREALGERRSVLAALPRGIQRGGLTSALARLDGRQRVQGARVVGEFASGYPLALSGDQQRRRLVATTERLMRHGRRGSPAAGPARPDR